MTTRSTRSNRTEDLVILSNAELARRERENRQNRPTPANMGDEGNQNINAQMAAQMQQLQQQIEQMQKAQQDREPRAQAAIGERDNPHTFYQNRSAIVPPPIQRQDFKIDPYLISLVKLSLFNGLPAENPMDHIESFEEICSTTSSNGVPPDFLKCKLFPFSLANKASRWLKSLPAGSLTSWAQCRSAFVDHFFTKSKTAALRTKIASFHQYDGEAFCEAWERYKEYRRECPHHGFSDEQILGIFYDGVNWDYRNVLNSASNGDFMTKSKDGAFELIENLAASSSNKSAEYDRTVSSVSAKGSGVEAQKIDELTAKVNLLLKASQKSVHFVDESDDTPLCQAFEVAEEEDDQMEVNYVNGQPFVQNRGFNPNYKSHPNLSYRSTNVENPQDQVYPPRSSQNQQGYQKNFGQQKVQFSNQQQAPSSSNNANDELKSMMQQMLANQQKSSAEINQKIDNMYNDLNGKHEAVWTHVKKLDVQVAQMAEAVKRPHGTLPGKGETNPRNEYVAVVETRSGRKLIPTPVPAKRTGKEKVDEDLVVETEELANEDDQAALSRVDRAEDEASSSQDPIPVSDEPTPVAAEAVPARVYKPKVPYPVPPKKSRKSLEEAKCKEMLRDLTVKLPLADAVQMIPALKRYMKELISGKVAEEENVMLVSEECSAVLQNKVVKKRSDPGRFVLSVKIGKMIFACSLCDLGSSVNLMPYSVAKRLGFTKFKPTKISLVFADRSTKFPVGILEDLHVQIGDTLIPADFVVLETDEEPKDPLILGRSFLCTAGAIIDVRGGIIDLQLGDMVMRFEMNRLLKRPMLDGQTFVVEDGPNLVEEVREELLLDDPLEVALSRAEGEFSYLNEEANGLAKMMDATKRMERLVAYMSLEDEEDSPKQKPDKAPALETPINSPWSELRAPKLELKTLPAGLRYAFLGPNSTYPVIVNSELNNVETALLLCELRKYRKAIGYSLDDIPGISPDLCMHRIHLEDESMTSIEHQRRLNPNLKDVVKKEIMKLLEAGVIYAISDSTCVSPVHVVPKKGGITVVKNDKNELIPTRTITGHRMCIDYRKLNAATRKDHFPLPFIDQMLERLANHPYYCFLDGYSGFFQIPIHPDDQEKTTFTCPYGTFAYRRMPFGLCNAPATFQRCMMSIFTDLIEDIMGQFAEAHGK